MKANTKEINYAKMLKHCWGLLGSASRTLSRQEFNQMQRAFAILLDTNILWLNHSYIDDILEKLEAGEITNSQAERIATRQLGVRPSVELEQRLADTNDCPDAVMQLFLVEIADGQRALMIGAILKKEEAQHITTIKLIFKE